MSTVLVLLILFASACPLPAQVRPETPLRTQVNLVLIPVTVIDRRGTTVNGLAPENFTVLEDNLPQRIASFSFQNAPCSVGIILDTSGSMRGTLNQAKVVAEQFLTAADLEDDFSLMGVSTRPESYSAFTSDLGALRRDVLMTKPGGRTALIDTIYLGLNRVRSARNSRRALLIISDGMDNHSRYTESELMRVALESDVQIYTVAVGAFPRNKKPIQLQDERKGRSLLCDVAEKTGGLHFVVTRPEDVAEAVTCIGLAMRNQYLIGYQPPDTNGTDKWHTIRIKLNVPHASVYTRSRYYR